MKKIDILELTKTLNQMRKKEYLLKEEMYSQIKQCITYPTFIPQLKNCGFVQVFGNYAAFQTTPIHYKKVEELVNNCRKKNKQYQNTFEENKKAEEKRQKADDILKAIAILKEEGFLVIKGGEIL